MDIEMNARQREAGHIARLKAACLDCEDCHGKCPQFQELAHLPEILLKSKGARV
ncbi:hypothetical protein [Actibacterium sp.]|uniref:hypothetical protein n=1 Tax=Actibacterium sp. TaxID=1872125 RepID=UPI0035669C4A